MQDVADASRLLTASRARERIHRPIRDSTSVRDGRRAADTFVNTTNLPFSEPCTIFRRNIDIAMLSNSDHRKDGCACPCAVPKPVVTAQETAQRPRNLFLQAKGLGNGMHTTMECTQPLWLLVSAGDECVHLSSRGTYFTTKDAQYPKPHTTLVSWCVELSLTRTQRRHLTQ